MADTYLYRVRDRHGSIVSGSLEADSTGLVVAKLRDLGYVPLSIDRKAAVTLKSDIKLPFFGDRIKLDALAVFSRQFATMIDSGLTLLRSLYILADQTESKPLAVVLREVRVEVERGASLSQALAKHPKAFPRLYVAMIRAGEVGGALDQVLLQLATTLEKQVELKRKVKSALTYPVAVLSLVLLILTAMLLFVVPTFKNLYSSLGGTLPLPTRLLLMVSHYSVILFPFLIVGAVVGTILFRRWIRTPKGRAAWDRAKLRAPIFSKLVHRTALARFSRTFASLLRAGVPLLESLEITKDTSGNAVVAEALADVQDAVKAGESIAHRLPSHPVFPSMVAQMISVGEETGALDSMLDKVASFYEQEVEALVNSLTSLLEPLLIVVLGGTVGSMVISLYMPMFNIIKLIK
ncbi:MAG TPA: type II secretion system F family protein [Acidimicrobiales bacterium]|nr:type II secretion system F family protein [Acidimicrobiales bacterium]